MTTAYKADDPILEAYLFDTQQTVEALERIIMESEKEAVFTKTAIDEIFRHMHTVKGSSAMMMFNMMAATAHKLEDIFYLIRENKDLSYDLGELTDLVLDSIDYFKEELEKIRNGQALSENQEELISELNDLYKEMKERNGRVGNEDKSEELSQKYYIRPAEKKAPLAYCRAAVFFKEGAEMENIRAYTIVHNLADRVKAMYFSPSDIIENEASAAIIKKQGFQLIFSTERKPEELKALLQETLFLELLEFETIEESRFLSLSATIDLDAPREDIKIPKTSPIAKEKERERSEPSVGGSMISVHVDKLDRLMDAVGELVITEAMVTQNPEITVLEIESFQKSARQLHKITAELRDMVMAIRMVPLSTTFVKMHRIVRDMSKKLGKDIVLDILGEETEVDKNIIDKITDPLMHMIRNAVDHGIEAPDKRADFNKPSQGNIVIEAKNAGSDVLISIRDDGRGLDKSRIYKKAAAQGLVTRAEKDMSDQEIFNLILLPGFSTKETVTEFSGRGVGMDVVTKNIQSIGGSVQVDSRLHEGTKITLKLPLTLAIIEGMNLKVGDLHFTMPMMAIQESFRPEPGAVIRDTDGMEMIMVRGACYPILRLHEHYKVKAKREQIHEGILIMTETENGTICIFADELLGQQQVVMKSLPNYLKRFRHMNGIGGCTLLGDGSISLILDMGTIKKDLSETAASA